MGLWSLHVLFQMAPVLLSKCSQANSSESPIQCYLGTIIFVLASPISHFPFPLFCVPTPFPCVHPFPLCAPLSPVPTPFPCTHPFPLCPPLSPVPTPFSCAHPFPLCPPLSPVPTPFPCAHPFPLCPPLSPVPTPFPCAHPFPLCPPFSPVPTPFPMCPHFFTCAHPCSPVPTPFPMCPHFFTCAHPCAHPFSLCPPVFPVPTPFSCVHPFFLCALNVHVWSMIENEANYSPRLYYSKQLITLLNVNTFPFFYTLDSFKREIIRLPKMASYPLRQLEGLTMECLLSWPFVSFYLVLRVLKESNCVTRKLDVLSRVDTDALRYIVKQA